MLVTLDVIDSMTGRPAEGIPVTLRRDSADGSFAPEITDAMGRVSWPEPAGRRGKYRLEVELDRYYGSIGVSAFQSCVQMDFRIVEADETVNLLLITSPTSNITSRLSADMVKS